MHVTTHTHTNEVAIWANYIIWNYIAVVNIASSFVKFVITLGNSKDFNDKLIKWRSILSMTSARNNDVNWPVICEQSVPLFYRGKRQATFLGSLAPPSPCMVPPLWSSSRNQPLRSSSFNPSSLVTTIITIITEIFMVLLSWQSHCENSPGSFDKCRLSAGWPPTLRPSQSTWTVSPPGMAATIRIHHRHLLLLSPKADTYFTVPRRVDGWVDLVGWLHTENKVPPPGVEPRHSQPSQY